MILVDYVSTTEFQCNKDGDLRSEFPAGRKFTAYQDVDGYTYCTIDSAAYDSGTDKTTVTITAALLTANLVSVRSGSSSPPSVAEHFHSGPNDGGRISYGSGSGASYEAVQYTAGETLSGHVVVVLNDSGEVVKADNTNADHLYRIAGITTQAISSGAVGYVQTYGQLTEPTWSWTMGLPVYMSTTGGLTQTPPSTGFLLKIGTPEDATTLFIRIGEPIQLA